MKLADMKKKTPAELHDHIVKLKNEIAEGHREKRNTNETNIRKKRNTRKEIARAMTIQREFELDNREEA